jgi:hypothetical protein
VTTTSKYYCPYCGSECDTDDREALETMREAADKIGYSVRCKRNRKGVFEILNDHGFVIGEGTSPEAIVNFLGAMAGSHVNPFREVSA